MRRRLEGLYEKHTSQDSAQIGRWHLAVALSFMKSGRGVVFHEFHLETQGIGWNGRGLEGESGGIWLGGKEGNGSCGTGNTREANFRGRKGRRAGTIRACICVE